MTLTNVARDANGSGSSTKRQTRFQQHLDALIGNMSRAVVASEETLRVMLLALVSQGHILLEDTPGVGKTLAAKSLAQSISGKFSRIQCTPDLLPSDVTGTSVFDMRESRFEFVPGPIFSNILLADEINRTGPRTQSALLEAMAERQVTGPLRRRRPGAPRRLGTPASRVGPMSDGSAAEWLLGGSGLGYWSCRWPYPPASSY